MTQNIYDDPAFFAQYSQFRRSVEGLDGAPEWPALRAMLPPLAGAAVLDLGCGFGWFSRYARQAGAASVDGIDVSERMLARARAETSDPAISYRQADLETVGLPTARYDVAFSSLVLHYIVDLDGLVGRVRRALMPGGAFVFSAEHPLLTAPSRAEWAEGPVWPLDNYLVEGPRRMHWLVDGVVKQHRTLGTLLTMLIGNGFTLAAIEEWQPTREQIAAHPDWARELHRPMFVLVGCRT